MKTFMEWKREKAARDPEWAAQRQAAVTKAARAYEIRMGRWIQEEAVARGCSADTGHEGPFEWDHILPVMEGAPKVYVTRARSYRQARERMADPNIQVLCAPCHREKSNQEVSRARRGIS